MIPAALRIALRRGGLRGEDYRVLGELYDHLDFVDYRRLKQWEIAAALRVHEGQVSRSLKVLTASGYVDRGPRIDRVYTYRLRVSPPEITPVQLLAGVVRRPDEHPRISSRYPDRRVPDAPDASDAPPAAPSPPSPPA